MVDGRNWNVVGQDPAVQHLQEAIAGKNVGHAYLLAGPHGIGKTTLALEFAKALLCLDRDDGIACGTCNSCRRIHRNSEARTHPDLTVADVDWQAAVLGNRSGSARQRLSIEAIRWLRQDIVSRPVLSRWKVQVVDDADLLSTTAPDAFLKTLEEPPGSAVIMLVASSVDNVPETIRSRCRIVQVGLVSRQEIIAALLDRGIAETDALNIAATARGRVAMALELSQVPDAMERWREEVTEAFTYISQPLERLRLAGPIAANHTKDRNRTFALLDHCSGMWRDILLLQAGLPDQVSHRELLGELSQLSQRVAVDDVLGALHATRRATHDLERNFQSRIAIMAMIQRWPVYPD